MSQKTAREENKAQAVTRETIYVPFRSYITTGFLLLCEHIPSVASPSTINVNHTSPRASFWLSLCLQVLSSFLVLFISSACLSNSFFFFLYFVCLLAFLCDSVWLFGLKLILSVPAGLGRTTQITPANQTPTPTVAFFTPLSRLLLFKFCTKSVWLISCPIRFHSPSVCVHFY